MSWICHLASPAPQREWRWHHYLLLGGAIVFLGFSSWVLFAQDARFEGERGQSKVVNDYKRAGQFYRDYPTSFFARNSPLSNPDLLSHPPGYAFLWATIFKLGGGDRTMQVIQILCNLVAAFVVFLIAAEVLPRTVAVIAALLAALAPQFNWNAVTLLPDTLAVLPILLAVYCLILAARRELMSLALLCGVLIGLSCWLRANGLLLAPFSALFAVLLFPRGQGWRYAAAIVFGAILIIAPLTIRNAIVFGHFIPLSLGAGQTMLEGIADYDKQQQFGIPHTDIAIMSEEAERFGRPDYADTLFGPDGIARERMRLAQALNVIGSHPFWFVSVMARRATSMFRLERVPLIAIHPTISHPLSDLNMRAATKTISPGELTVSSAGVVRLSPDGQTMEFKGDDSKYGIQLTSGPMRVQRNTDYVFTIPLRISKGRLAVEVRNSNQDIFGRMFVDTDQKVNTLQLAFVAAADEEVKLIIRNGDSSPGAEIGTLAFFELGQSAQTWTRLPRIILRTIQKLFVTAVALPLMILGLLVLFRAGCCRVVAVLWLVPLYFLIVQSVIHTEYRYVLALHYFLFVIVATAIWFLGVTALNVGRAVGVPRRSAPR